MTENDEFRIRRRKAYMACRMAMWNMAGGAEYNHGNPSQTSRTFYRYSNSGPTNLETDTLEFQ